MRLKSKSIGLSCLSLGFMLAVAYNLAPAQPDEARVAIETGNKRFVAALGRHDAAGIAELYGANAQALPPNSDIVRGKPAIEKFWKGVIDSGVQGATLNTLDVESAGDLAYEVGSYVMTGESGKALDNGKYVVIWKREQGKWKLHRDIWNSSAPAQRN